MSRGSSLTFSHKLPEVSKFDNKFEGLIGWRVVSIASTCAEDWVCGCAGLAGSTSVKYWGALSGSSTLD